ncbi:MULTISPECIES: hypothetical protein [Neobacillus]|nr:hypothetical protein [Neobacillus sedimentimangrovi]
MWHTHLFLWFAVIMKHLNRRKLGKCSPKKEPLF